MRPQITPFLSNDFLPPFQLQVAHKKNPEFFNSGFLLISIFITFLLKLTRRLKFC